MRVYLLIVLLFSVQSSSAKDQREFIGFKSTFNAPESVYVDSDSGFIFVSNVVGDGLEYDNDGWISKLDTRGNIVSDQWLKDGLHAPKGMGVYNGILYVTDIQFLVSIDIAQGKIIKKQKIKDSVILNDIAISKSDGTVYISDTMGNKIYKVVQGEEPRVFIHGEQLESPNGLYIQEETLIVAAWGSGIKSDWSTDKKGSLFRIDLKSREKSFIVTELGQLDGVEADPNNSNILYVTDWVAGILYQIEGKKVTKKAVGISGAADIGVISNGATLEILVPSMTTNRVLRVPVR